MTTQVPWFGYHVYQENLAYRLETEGIQINKITYSISELDKILEQDFPVAIVSQSFPIHSLELPAEINNDPVSATCYVIGEIRRTHKDIPIIVAYELQREDIFKQYSDAGATDFYNMFSLHDYPTLLVDMVNDALHTQPK